ncbi:sphingoid base hydroxylase 2 [Prunus dulcis]|uniref:Sphingoid base hydroxylase 2 n=1 Tax=Prunus dulcis TaxID=3755 RepID=A0A4Y1RAL0_PRUDU|nr:sphingoid base hydroxylase 2 [Prunus dulcis]
MGFEVSDELLGTFVPVLIYWAYSGIYVVLDSFENYRLHTRKDEDEKNLVSKRTVVKGVLLQQTIQAIVAILLFTVTGNDDGDSGVKPSFIDLARQFVTAMIIHASQQVLIQTYPFPTSPACCALCIWSSVQSPCGGLLLDTIGGALSFLLSGMSPRASIFFFSFATIKTVDDHCGLWLPGNLFHVFFSNNTAYHDVHHQLYGSKYNFSQPFFVMWDRILGTHMPYSLEKRAGGGFEVRPKKVDKEN